MTKSGLATFLIVSCLSLSAQVDTISVNTNTTESWDDFMDYTYGSLDTTDITTGFFGERGLQYFDPSSFNGASNKDTILHEGVLHYLYDFIKTSAISESHFSSISAWESWAESTEFDSPQHLILPIIHYEYQGFLEDSTQLFQAVYIDENGQFQDVEEPPFSPYQSENLFAIAPLKSIIRDSLNINFEIDDNYIFTNISKEIEEIAIDVDDGNGLTSINLNEALSVSYQQYGRKVIRVKVTYTDNTSFESYSIINILEPKFPSSPGKTFDGIGGYSQFRDNSHYITSGQGLNLGAILEIEYGCGGANKIRRPFIIVEGFNSPEFDDHPRGQTYSDFFRDFLREYDLTFQSLGSFDIIDALQEAGYDLIYVDFDNALLDMRENAYVLMEAINWINQEKALNGSTEPNVLMGISMGGVIGRYALTTMENESPGTHNVRYYISFDSPHLGANVPGGMQTMVNHLYYSCKEIFNKNYCIRDYEPDLVDGYSVLHSVAAQQLLLYMTPELPQFLKSGATISSDPFISSLHTSFYNELSQLGMPQETERNIAVANGNDAGQSQGYSTLEDIFVAYCDNNSCFLVNQGININFRYDLLINAAPGNTSTPFTVYRGEIWHEVLYGNIKKYIANTYEYKMKNATPYDNAPGGAYNFEYFGLNPNDLSFNATVKDGFCFIPTVSALNITSELNNPHYTADEQTVVSLAKTNFDEVHLLNPEDYPDEITAPNNEPHTALTPSNVDVFENFLFNDLTGPEDVGAIYQTKYNFSLYKNPANNEITKTTDRITDVVTVSGTSTTPGKLCINCTGELAFPASANPYSNSDHFQVLIADACDGAQGSVTVQSNGIVEVGENLSKTGSLIVENDGRLVIQNGGKIIVNDGSELIIADGGTLRFLNGGEIELAGPNSKIVIQGQISVPSNTVLTFTGSGKVVFDQNMRRTDFWGNPFIEYDDYWDIGANSELIFEGNQVFTDVIVETKRQFLPRMNSGQTFSKIEFKRGKVLIGEDAPIHVYNSLTLLNVEFNTANAGLKHAGLRLHYNSTATNSINNARFKNGEKALIAHWYNSTSPLEINNSLFEDNTIGFHCDRGNFSLSGCDFYNNAAGINGYLITGTSSITNSTFDGNATGVVTLGQTGTTLNSISSNYTDNNRGIDITDMNLSIKCSQFANNIGEGIHALNTIIYANDDADNQFFNNQHGIKFDGDEDETGIYLEDGNNEFNLGAPGASYTYNTQPTKTYIYGNSDGGIPQSDYHATQTNYILANNNKMPVITIEYEPSETGPPSPSIVQVLPVDIGYTIICGTPQTCRYDLYLDIPNNLSSISHACENIDPFSDDLPPREIAEGIEDPGNPLGGGKWSGETVKEALLESLDSLTVTGEQLNDVHALDDLQEILLERSHSTDQDEQKLLKITYDLMQMAFGNAYKYGQLVNTENNASVVESAVNRSIAIIDSIIGNLDSSQAVFYSRNFNYHLDKAQTYRLGGYYDQALTVLAGEYGWAEGDDLLRTGFWTCVCEAERDYVEEEIDDDGLMEALETCHTTYAGHNYKKENNRPVNFYQTYSDDQYPIKDIYVFPNPASDYLNLQLAQSFNGNVAFSIFDVAGKLVLYKKQNWTGISGQLNVQNLVTGVYTLKATFGESSLIKKITMR